MCFLRSVLELRNKWFISRFICGVARALRHRSFPKILVAVCQNLVGVQSKLHEFYIYHTSKIFKNKIYIFWSISIYTFFIVSTFHWETTVPNIPYNIHSFSILQCIPKYSCTVHGTQIFVFLGLNDTWFIKCTFAYKLFNTKHEEWKCWLHNLIEVELLDIKILKMWFCMTFAYH